MSRVSCDRGDISKPTKSLRKKKTKSEGRSRDLVCVRSCVCGLSMTHRQTDRGAALLWIADPVTMDVFHSVRSICCDVYTRDERQEVVNLLHYLCLSTLELSELRRIYCGTLSFLMAHSYSSLMATFSFLRLKSSFRRLTSM